MGKATLRQQLLDWRNGLNRSYIYMSSMTAQYRLITSDAFQNARKVCSYIAIGNEMRTHHIIEDAMAMGKEVTVPLLSMDNTDKKTVVCRLKDISLVYDPGFRVMMDIDNDPRIERAEPGSSDFVVVPGVAFDKRGHRIGMGSGSYDRDILPRESEAVFAGLAFDEQVVGEIEYEPHDIPMDIIATPARMINAIENRRSGDIP